MSFAMALLDAVIKIAEQKNAKKVENIHLAIGNMLMINQEQLKFCFDVVARGTVAEGAKLEIEEVKADITCTSCGKKFEEYIGICDKCGGILNVEGGKDMILKNVEMEV